MNQFRPICASAVLWSYLLGRCVGQSQPTEATISKIDHVIRARFANIESYTVTEHFAVFRNGATLPAAERTVQATYEKNTGATYKTIAQSGSATWQSQVIEPSLNSDQQINDPGMRSQLMLTTDNYEFKLKPDKSILRGRNCVVLDVKARRPSTYLINGQAWADAATSLLVRVQGTQFRSQSIWAGTPLVTRDFTSVKGFAPSHPERRSFGRAGSTCPVSA